MYYYYIILNLRVTISHMSSVLYVQIITFMFFFIIYTYIMPSPICIPVYV